MIADPINPARFYGLDSRNGKIYASTNAATDFFELGGVTNASAFRWSVLSATPGIEGDLWLNCQERGLYHRTGGVDGFLKIPAVKDARVIGFGKAAEGKTFPAIYLLGRIEEVNGLFRSTDTGTTWVRINDDQHQWGRAGDTAITGDPRIFGRVYFGTNGRGIIYGDGQ